MRIFTLVLMLFHTTFLISTLEKRGVDEFVNKWCCAGLQPEEQVTSGWQTDEYIKQYSLGFCLWLGNEEGMPLLKSERRTKWREEVNIHFQEMPFK